MLPKKYTIVLHIGEKDIPMEFVSAKLMLGAEPLGIQEDILNENKYKRIPIEKYLKMIDENDDYYIDVKSYTYFSPDETIAFVPTVEYSSMLEEELYSDDLY